MISMSLQFSFLNFTVIFFAKIKKLTQSLLAKMIIAMTTMNNEEAEYIMDNENHATN